MVELLKYLIMFVASHTGYLNRNFHRLDWPTNGERHRCESGGREKERQQHTEKFERKKNGTVKSEKFNMENLWIDSKWFKAKMKWNENGACQSHNKIMLLTLPFLGISKCFWCSLIQWHFITSAHQFNTHSHSVAKLFNSLVYDVQYLYYTRRHIHVCCWSLTYEQLNTSFGNAFK